MVTGKQGEKALSFGLEGCGAGSSAWRLGKRAHGRTSSASWGTAMRPDGHKEIARRVCPSAKGPRPSGRIDSGKWREARIASRGGPGHAPSSTRGSAGGLPPSTMKDVALGVFRYGHGREKCPRSPGWATRFARGASGSAVKGHPLSCEGGGLQGKGSAHRNQGRPAAVPAKAAHCGASGRRHRDRSSSRVPRRQRARPAPPSLTDAGHRRRK